MCDTTCDAQIQQCCPFASVLWLVVRIQNSPDYFLGTGSARLFAKKSNNSSVSKVPPRENLGAPGYHRNYVWWPRCRSVPRRGILDLNVGSSAPLWPATSRAIASSLRQPSPHPLVRMTCISKSRIFLRSVLRLTPNRSAARIWLPRVAASAAERRGYSISRRIR